MEVSLERGQALLQRALIRGERGLPSARLLEPAPHDQDDHTEGDDEYEHAYAR
jgi:hypothetical protein